MKKPIQISIPAPCHENWDKMTPGDKGRFCASGQKNVRDFTKASDREILLAFSNSENICGQFLASQLERDLIVPKERTGFWAAMGAIAISLFTLGIGTASAQTPINTHIVAKEDILIRGMVSDQNAIPIHGVNITVKTTGQQLQTDIDGNFEIKVKYGDVLEFNYVGMTTQLVEIGDRKAYDIVMYNEKTYGSSLKLPDNP